MCADLLEGLQVMKLHVYDHCPYCIRARMRFGLKNNPVELVFVANDDEDTPLCMIGKKMLPILEDANSFMGESLDIVRKVDGRSGKRQFDGEPSPAILDWLDHWNPVINALVIPRTPDPAYPEFRTASAQAYFTRNKEAIFGNFPGLLDRTESFKAELVRAFATLAQLLPDPEEASINDILLFPILRSLTVMPDLEMPVAIAAYAERMAERVGLPLVGTLRAEADTELELQGPSRCLR